MSYQKLSNLPEANTSTSTTVAHTEQPAVIHTPQQTTYNPFASKAGVTKKLGIAQLVIGIIVFIMGIIMIPIAPHYWGSHAGGGIWSGIFIIVAGSVCLAAGSSPEKYGTRCAALTFCIISLAFLFTCAVINISAFVGEMYCSDVCYDSYDRRICRNDCSITGAILSLILSILLLALFVITLISAIHTGRGCCFPDYPSGYIVTQPVMATSGVVAVSNHQTTTTPMTYPNQLYAGAPGGHQPPFSGYQMSGYQPEAHSFPDQQQQNNQAATGQSNVTDGVDYNQQMAGIPE